jgi:antitoxin component YwqK of YwqJK toxin-antitoxin module
VGKINPFSSEEKKKKIEELLKVLKESKKSIEEISCEDGIEVICNQENREKIDGGIEIIEEKKDGDDAKMVKNELEELLTLLNEIKQKCVEYDSTKKNSEGGDNKQEEPTTKEVSNDEEEGGEGGDVTQEEPKEEKTTTKVIPTELMDCDEVEMGDDWDDEGYTGLFKFCENGKATSVTERKDGKDHGLYRSWDTNGNLEIEWNYKNGKLDGISKSWYGDGKLSDIEYFINNNKVSKEEYLKTMFSDVDAEFVDDDITSGEKDNIEVKNVDKKPTGSGDIIGVNYRTGKKTIDGVLKKVKDKDGKTTFIIKNRKVPILNPRRNGFIDDDAKRGVMDALKNIGIDTTNKTINVINDRKFTIK